MGTRRLLIVGLALCLGACARDADEGAPVATSTSSAPSESTTSRPTTTTQPTVTSAAPSSVVVDASGRRVCDRAWAEGGVMASGDRYLQEQLFDAVEYISTEASLSAQSAFFLDPVADLAIGASDATESGDITEYGLALLALIDVCQDRTDWVAG